MTNFTELVRARHREDGFTLIEPLVVMIIIGILAAVAVPIFMNQQKTARDTQTVSDVKNMMTEFISAQVQYPDGAYFVILDQPIASVGTLPVASGSANVTDANGDGKLTIAAGRNSTQSTLSEVSVSPGTYFNISNGGGTPLPDGQFRMRAWNPDGKAYTSASNGYLVSTNKGGYIPGG